MYLSLEVISTWPLPNYVDPVTRGSGLIVMHLVLYPIILGLVVLRTYTRLQISRSFGLDDVFILLAMLPTTAFVAITLVAEFRYGWDRHAWDVLPDMVSVGLQLSLATQILYGLASALTRLSMLFLCRRILSAQSRTLRNIIVFAITIISLAQGVFIIVVIFQCRPVSAWWTLSFVPQQCINESIHLLVQGILNIIADFLVVLIPIPVVLKLNLPFRQRIIVAMLFGAGFVVCFAGVVRTIYMYRVTENYYDVTWDAYPVWLSTAIELYIGIVCTSIPPTKPFFARYLPKLLTTTHHHGSSRGGSRGGWTPTFGSSKNVLKQTNTAGSRNADTGNPIQFLDLDTPPHSAGGGGIHKGGFQSSISEFPSTKTSIEHLVV